LGVCEEGLREQPLGGESVEGQDDLPPDSVRIPGLWQIALQGLGDGIHVMLAVTIGPDERRAQAQRLGATAACVIETKLAVHRPQGEVSATTGIGITSMALLHVT